MLPFQQLLHRGVREGATPFPRLRLFTLDPYLIMLSDKQGCIKYHFWVFGMNRLGIEPRSPGTLANTLYMYSQKTHAFILSVSVFLSHTHTNEKIYCWFKYFIHYYCHKLTIIITSIAWHWYLLSLLLGKVCCIFSLSTDI